MNQQVEVEQGWWFNPGLLLACGCVIRVLNAYLVWLECSEKAGSSVPGLTDQHEIFASFCTQTCQTSTDFSDFLFTKSKLYQKLLNKKVIMVFDKYSSSVVIGSSLVCPVLLFIYTYTHICDSFGRS